MEKFHKEAKIMSLEEEIVELSNQDDLPNSEESQISINEVQQGATRLRNNKILKRVWNPNN